MQLIDLFSGIGGFSLSGNWMRWRTIQFCENNKFCKQILTKHWPEIPIYDDIRTLTIQQIISNKLYDPKEKTIITAGVPCQPWSNAGKRQGETDIRNLWSETIKFTELFHPDFALFENVPGLLTWNKGLFFENICTSLENAGYEIWPFIIPSASIGAWDKRDRVWIVAYSDRNSNCNRPGRIFDKKKTEKLEAKRNKIYECSISPNVNSDIKGSVSKQSGKTRSRRDRCSNSISLITDIISVGRENGLHGGESEWQAGKCSHSFKESDWWKRNWIEVASELCRSNARVSYRMDRIKALGNSVNPYIVYELFKAIEQHEILQK